MMNKKLVLFTQEFPCGSGEPFLETELPYLEKFFDEILIVATALSKSHKQTREVSEKVKYIAVNRPKGKAKVVWGVFNGLKYADKNLIREECALKGLKKKAAAIYYYGRYKTVYKCAEKEISDFIGEVSEQTYVCLYSYWFIETAQIACDFGRKIRSAGGSCLVCTRAHGFDLYENRNAAAFFPFRKKVLSEIDYVFPCSESGESYLKTKFPEVSEKISVRYLGTKDYGENPAEGSGEFVIVTCSNLVPVKRLHLLAEALTMLDREYPCAPVKWVCIGDGPERVALEKITKEIKDISVVFTGRLKNTDILKWYQENHVDLFVNTSASEGAPVSIMEACSFGIPILATAVGGTPEIVVSELNGFLLPENVNPRELCEEIKCCLEAKETKKLRKGARKLWEVKFDAAENYSDFAQELIGNRLS